MHCPILKKGSFDLFLVIHMPPLAETCFSYGIMSATMNMLDGRE